MGADFRFMGKHISELYETVRNSSGKDRQTDWNNVEQRVKEQLPLRAVTCIQVSSKLASHYKVSLRCLNFLYYSCRKHSLVFI